MTKWHNDQFSMFQDISQKQVSPWMFPFYAHPFVIGRKPVHLKDGRTLGVSKEYWLEFCPRQTTSNAELLKSKRPRKSKLQKLETWIKLPRVNYVSANGFEFWTTKAVSERVPGWKVVRIKLTKGFLWTCVPKKKP